MARPSSAGRRRAAGRRRGAPPTRSERRRAAERRRGRFILAVGLVLSAVALAAWFPGAALLHQRQALSDTSYEVTQLTQQDRALAREEQRLQSPAEVARIARQQYQLVSPGQTPYQVLPPSSATRSSAAATYAGDPGLQPPVDPSAAAELPPGSAGTAAVPGASATSGRSVAVTVGAGAAATTGRPAAPSTLWSRIVQTLEFWR